ncbi:hypothetical protein I5R65_18790 [Herbaspirillum sp. AP02]|nr:hypothetical protein [Herbaspirillum sp. AP02]NZD69607.1 hypothetical protein [Herbaspirillum sp. AP21]
MPWLLAARRKKLRHLLPLLLLKLRPLLLRLLMQSRLTPLLLLTLPSRLTPLLRLLTLSLLTLLLPLTQSRLKPLRPSNLRIIVRKPVARPVFFRPDFPRSSLHQYPVKLLTSDHPVPPSRTHQKAPQAIPAR